MDMYREIILDHYKHPRHYGTLKHAHIRKTRFNSACGDTVTMHVVFDGKGSTAVVRDVSFSGEGCAISQAAASMLTEFMIGKKVHDLLGVVPDTIYGMLGTELTPSRTKCALLSLETMKEALSGYAETG